MVKPVNFKPNILQRKKAVQITKRVAKELPRDKGQFEGSCNRSACLKPGANWYNHSTQRYYCAICAYELNEDSFNRRASQEMYGHKLCTLGKFDPNWDYVLDCLKS